MRSLGDPAMEVLVQALPGIGWHPCLPIVLLHCHSTSKTTIDNYNTHYITLLTNKNGLGRVQIESARNPALHITNQRQRVYAAAGQEMPHCL